MATDIHAEDLQQFFIDFLKKEKSFNEYKEECIFQCEDIEAFENVLSDITTDKEESFEYVLSDGYSFFYKRAITDVNWKSIEEKWDKYYKEVIWQKL